jgi:hypothetical protein
MKYGDFPIWSNLDREHLFLYISHHKKSNDKVPDLSFLIEKAHKKQLKNKPSFIDPASDEYYPFLGEGVFVGRFNFNLAQLIHAMMSGNGSKNEMQRESTNVLFDTDNNRIFTVTDFARDVLDRCDGEHKLSEIIRFIKEKYQMSFPDAESKCRNFLNGLIAKNIICSNTK